MIPKVTRRSYDTCTNFLILSTKLTYRAAEVSFPLTVQQTKVSRLAVV